MTNDESEEDNVFPNLEEMFGITTETEELPTLDNEGSSSHLPDTILGKQVRHGVINGIIRDVLGYNSRQQNICPERSLHGGKFVLCKKTNCGSHYSRASRRRKKLCVILNASFR
jgi:hypothetical protein